jgi:hypothetical protein
VTGPETIRDYMSALNASLEVGLRSRRSILRELYDHLCQAADEELRRGETEQEAQRRAIAAFGSPQEVAAGFASGLAGQIDRRLAVVAKRVDVWMAQHPWGGAALRTALFLPPAAGLAAVGAALGAVVPALQAANFLLVTAACWSLYLGFKARRLRRRPEPGLRERMWAEDPRLLGIGDANVLGVQGDAILGGERMAMGFLLALVSYGGWFGVEGEGGQLAGSANAFAVTALMMVAFYLSALGTWVLCQTHTGKSARGGSRSQHSSLLAFRREHTWWGALLHASYLPLSALAIALLLSPGPLGYRLALGAMIVGMTATVAVFRCLSWNRDERVAIQRELRKST